MKARLGKMIGLPGRVASVTSIGIRVRRTASTNTPPLFSNIRDVALRRSSRVRSRKVVLEVVHGGSGCEARRLRGGHHGRAKSASFRARHAASDNCLYS